MSGRQIELEIIFDYEAPAIRDAIYDFAASRCLCASGHRAPYICDTLLWRAPRGVVIKYIFVLGNKKFSRVELRDGCGPLCVDEFAASDLCLVQAMSPLVVGVDHVTHLYLRVEPPIDYLYIWYLYDDLEQVRPYAGTAHSVRNEFHDVAGRRVRTVSGISGQPA